MASSVGRAAGAAAREVAEEPPDAALAARVQQGEREAFELLARRYLRPVLAVVAAYLTRTADREDAAQDAFLRALEGIRLYDPGRPFGPWLYQIARNVARNRRRADRRRPTEPLAGAENRAAMGAPDPADDAERAELRAVIEAVMEELPERQRLAFRLFDVEGYDAAEIERLTGIKAATVRSHVYHARRALRTRLAVRLGRRTEP